MKNLNEYDKKLRYQPEWSEAPLTFGEMVNLIDSIKLDCTEFDGTYIDWIRESNLEGEEELEYLDGFVKVNSSFYPQLEGLFHDRADAWMARKQQEYEAERGEWEYDD